MSERPNIAGYDDYRVFLADFITHKQEHRAGFSYRRLARLAGIASPNFLRMVVLGQKNMTALLAATVAKALSLSTEEQACFVALVALERAAGEGERELARTALERARRQLVSRTIRTSDIGRVLSSWHHLVVRELAQLGDFEPNGAWMAKRLGGLVTPDQAEDSLCLLLRTGFLRFSEGRFVVDEPVIDTGDGHEIAGFLLNAHVETWRVWQKLVAAGHCEERELGLLTIPLPRSMIPELKARVRAFQDELIGWLQNVRGSDALVQVGTYLVPLTTPVSAPED